MSMLGSHGGNGVMRNCFVCKDSRSGLSHTPHHQHVHLETTSHKNPLVFLDVASWVAHVGKS
jgi:hypothetical protein